LEKAPAGLFCWVEERRAAQHPGHELCDVGDCFLTAQRTK